MACRGEPSEVCCWCSRHSQKSWCFLDKRSDNQVLSEEKALRVGRTAPGVAGYSVAQLMGKDDSTLGPGGESLQSLVSRNPAAPGAMGTTEYHPGQLYHQVSTNLCVCSVVSDSLPPHGLHPARLLCPRDFPGKNTAVCFHFLLQGIFLTQGSHSGIQGSNSGIQGSICTAGGFFLLRHQGRPSTSLAPWKPNFSGIHRTSRDQ